MTTGSTDRLRVGIDVTPLVGPPTGIHQHTRHLIDALALRDDVAVSGWLLSARGETPDVPGPTRRSPVPATLAAHTWRVSGFPSRRLLAGDVDVVHGTNFLAPPHPTSVITVQDLTPLERPDLVEPDVAAKGPAIRRIIDAGAWVHVSSEAVGAELAALTGSERIRVVHHAVPAALPTPPGAGRRLVGHERYVVAVGTTERRKRVDLVVAAMAELPSDVALAIVGPPGNAEDAVATAIERHGLHDRVVRLTGLDDADRAAVVADAAALALASSYEGFGLTPLEAVQAGTPIAATAVGALPELIGDLVPLAAGSEDFAERLLAAVDGVVSSSLRDRVAAMTWDQHADRMMDLYSTAARS